MPDQLALTLAPWLTTLGKVLRVLLWASLLALLGGAAHKHAEQRKALNKEDPQKEKHTIC